MKTSFLTLQGLPIGKPLSFLEMYIMSLICPYCLSDQVIKVVDQQVNGTESSGLAASACPRAATPCHLGCAGN